MASTVNVSINFLKELALDAGKTIESQISQTQNVQTKFSDSDLFTETDVEVEKQLKSRIASQFPTHVFLCEESAAKGQKLTHSPTWIVDPIDGTTNFVHGLPLVCVSIAFADGGAVQHGVVYNPLLHMMFSASKGKGAELNGSPISPSTCKTVTGCLTATGFMCGKVHKLKRLETIKDKSSEEALLAKRLKEAQDVSDKNFQYLIATAHDVRSIGTCALACCFVAAGHLDCYSQLGIFEWDLAAGCLIAAEAGASITKFDGVLLEDLNYRQVVVAATKELSVDLCANLCAPTYDLRCLD